MSHISVASEGIYVKFGTRIVTGHTRMTWAQNKTFDKIPDSGSRHLKFWLGIFWSTEKTFFYKFGAQIDTGHVTGVKCPDFGKIQDALASAIN